jgi:hypothetical protein
MTGTFFTLVAKFALNGFALFGSVIGLYFFLAQYHLNLWFHLFIVLIVGATWAVRSLLYFWDEFAKIINGRMPGTKK